MNTHYSFGFGVARCSACGSAPIRNRGCESCLSRLCASCAPGHQCSANRFANRSAELSTALADAHSQLLDITSQMTAFAEGPLKGLRIVLLAGRQEYESNLNLWSTTLNHHAAALTKCLQAAEDARKDEFAWGAHLNPLSRQHSAAEAAYEKESASKSQCEELQRSLQGTLRQLSIVAQECEKRMLPPLLMRLGTEELLDGDALGVVRGVVGNYGGFTFGLQAMLQRYRGEEVQNFSLAARELQRNARALGADAVVGVRWLQCDEFEIEVEDEGNRVVRRQRHKPFEAMLCGTAVRASPAKAQQALATGQIPFGGHMFCSTIREPPYGAVVVESFGIVQGVGVNANYNFTFNQTAALQNLATSEALAFTEAHQCLMAEAQRLGANAVLGVKPEEPFHGMCVLRGTAVRLAVCSSAVSAQPLTRIEGQLAPSSLQSAPANLHIIECIGLVSAVGMRPPRWFTWDDPARTEETAFYNATQALSQHALQLGANAVFGVKWMHDNDRFLSNVVGTAVVLGRLPLPTPHLELPYTLVPFASTLREPPQGFRVSAIVGLSVAASVSPFYSRGNWQSRLSAQGEVFALQNAVQRLQASAAQMGAHAILGVKIEALSVYNCSRFMVVLKGTAVQLAQHEEAAQLHPFHGERVEISSMQAPAAHLCVAQVHGLVCAVGYRPWRWAWGFKRQRRQDAENEHVTFVAAVQSLEDQARRCGANGVMAIKWQHDDDHRSSCLVGTAVTLAQRPGARLPASLGSGRGQFITTSRTPPAGMEVAHTIGVVSGGGMSPQIFAFGAQARANIDKDAFDGALACLQHNATTYGCHAVLGMKMESPEPGLVILRGTAVQLTCEQIQFLPMELNGVRVLFPESSDTWRVTNAIGADTPGLAYRASKHMEHKHGSLATWGALVCGADDGDGWLRCA